MIEPTAEKAGGPEIHADSSTLNDARWHRRHNALSALEIILGGNVLAGTVTQPLAEAVDTS